MEPVLEGRTTEKQAHTTSAKAKVQGAIEFLEADGQKGRKRDVFQFFSVGHTQDYQILNDKHINLASVLRPAANQNLSLNF
jgi:hypothetical protein